jgi:hypothetical protein
MNRAFLAQRAAAGALLALLARVTSACSSDGACSRVLAMDSGGYASSPAPEASPVLSPSFKTSAILFLGINRSTNTVTVEYARGTQRVVETWRIDGAK